MPKYISEVMSGDPALLDENKSVHDAACVMRDRNIGDVLVTRDGKLHGILTDRDIVVRAVADDRPGTSRLGDICKGGTLITVAPTDTLDKAAALMRDNAVRRLPVVQDGIPVGVVSLGDLAEEQAPRSVLGRISEAAPTR